MGDFKNEAKIVDITTINSQKMTIKHSTYLPPCFKIVYIIERQLLATFLFLF
jgi:hypothetical protein